VDFLGLLFIWVASFIGTGGAELIWVVVGIVLVIAIAIGGWLAFGRRGRRKKRELRTVTAPEPLEFRANSDEGPARTRRDTGRLGTRFLIFPQPPFVPGYERPEVVWLSTPPDQIVAGPANRRLYVVDPLNPKVPYQYPHLPPCTGPLRPPAEPGPDGHFDYLNPTSRQFLAAHAFACVHRVLDICENYVGGEIRWFFAPTYERLEIVPHLVWNNSQSGYGFLEMGEDESREDGIPYALNFDAIAHETGHLVLLSTLGVPSTGNPTSDFLAYHEAIADFISLIGLLHFDTALDRILRRTRGNLLVMNELDRFAELSDEKQVRVFSHSLKLQDVGQEIHDRSKPFTGAMFDSLIDVYQVLLLERGLTNLDVRKIDDLRNQLTQADVENELSITRENYETRHFAVKSALTEARDILGEALARSWSTLSPDGLSFGAASESLITACENVRNGQFADRLYRNFEWRGIL
jgi:hypothetical protein